jgi:hypothetical protein
MGKASINDLPIIAIMEEKEFNFKLQKFDFDFQEFDMNIQEFDMKLEDFEFENLQKFDFNQKKKGKQAVKKRK